MALENLPNIRSELEDYQLTAAPALPAGDRVLLVGTASQGPVNQPIAIATPEDAINMFGSADKGTLVRGFAEAYFAPGGAKDIRLVRISNGDKASLVLNETAGVDENKQTIDPISGLPIPAMVVTARYPGSIYNLVSFRQEYINGKITIVAYNPISKQESYFVYDPFGQDSSAVSDVVGLANAINADANMSSVVVAEANEIRTSYEIDVQDDMPFVTKGSGSFLVDLISAFKQFDYKNDDMITTDDVASTTLAADIDNVATSLTVATVPDFDVDGSTGYLKLYEVVNGEVTNLEIVKYTNVDTATKTYTIERAQFGTAAVAHTVAQNTIVDHYVPFYPMPLAATCANRIVKLNEVYILDNYSASLDSAGKTQIELPYPSQVDGTLAKPILGADGTVKGDGEAIHVVTNSIVGTGDGSTTVFEFSAYEEINSATLKVFKTSSAGVTVQLESGYTLTSPGGENNDKIASITFDSAPSADTVITVSYESEPFPLSQETSLAAVQATNSYRSYFIAGDKIYFGTAQPADMKIIYQAKLTFRIGSDVVLTNAKDGKISFTGIDVDTSTIKHIGLDYTYQPEWVDLSAAKSLQDGSDGIEMTNNEKYKLLANLYDAIADYPVEVIALMNTYLDDTKIVYDDETGLPVEVNAGFAEQLNEHLESLMDGVSETCGVIAVKPAASPRIDDVKNWYRNLTETSMSDRNRAANVMAGLNARLLNVVVYEPIIANNIVNFPYATTGEAHYAGMISKLAPASAPTNKPLGAEVIALRYNLSARQLNTLAGYRYVAGRVIPGVGNVICDAVTAASSDSDWTRLTSFRIVAAAMKAIRSVARPFIGEGFSAAKRAALDSAITTTLGKMKEDGSIIDYNFSIEQTPEEFVSGSVRIPLEIRPAFELRVIKVIVKLTA